MREPIGKLADFEAMIRLLPSLRFTLDIGHCLQNEDDFNPFIKNHASRIENIHLHDGIPRGKAHLGLGNGCLDLGRFLDVLATVGFNKYVGIETITPEDTQASWESLCKEGYCKGVRNPGCFSNTAMPSASFNRV